jgi:hypothetical protein
MGSVSEYRSGMDFIKVMVKSFSCGMGDSDL